MQENMYKLHVNITLFYIRDLSIHGFWYPVVSWTQPPQTLRENCIRISWAVLRKI